jgi:nucleoside-diphosphate-sugar epimerase
MVVEIFRGKKILVVGGAGYLATNLMQLLQDTDCHIVRLDRPGAKFSQITGKAQFQDIEGDIYNRSVWDMALAGVDTVFHFAAQTSMYMAEKYPLVDLNNNVVPMINLLEACRDMGIYITVLFSGTVTQVGITEELPVTEGQTDNPITIYDLNKLMAENYLKHYSRGGIVRGTVLRLANVYGPGPKSGSADRGVLNMMIRKALKGESLQVYGTGDYLRDYVYVEDVALAFLAAAANIDKVNGKHFVIGSGEGHTISKAINLVADRVALKTGHRTQVINVDPPRILSPIDVRNFVSDTSSFKVATGWRTSVSLVEGIDHTIDHFLNERDES